MSRCGWSARLTDCDRLSRAKWQGSKHEEAADLRHRKVYSYTEFQFKSGVKLEMVMSYHRSDKLQNLAETREQKRDLCRETNRGGVKRRQ